MREKISFKYGGMTYTYGTGDDDFGLLNAGRTEASCNLDVFCNVYPCVCAEGSKKRALNNWFEVLECNDGVNIFDPNCDKEVQRRLNSSEYAFLRTSPGKMVMRK